MKKKSKLMCISLAALFIFSAFFIVISLYLSHPEPYTIAFSDVSIEQQSYIVSILKENNITWKTDDQGAILLTEKDMTRINSISELKEYLK